LRSTYHGQLMVRLFGLRPLVMPPREMVICKNVTHISSLHITKQQVEVII